MVTIKTQPQLPWLFAIALSLVAGCDAGKPGDGARPVQMETAATLLAFSSDGKTLATSDGSCAETRLWDTGTGRLVGEVEGQPDTGGLCRYLAFSPDGSLAASVHEGGIIGEPYMLVHLWSVTPEQRLRLARTLLARRPRDGDSESWVFHVSFSPDGKRLTHGTANGTVYVWDVGTGKELLQFQGGVAAAFAAKGKVLLTVTHDGLVRRWDASNGAELESDEQRTDFLHVEQVAFDGSGRYVAMSDGHSVSVKDVSLSGGHGVWVKDVSFGSVTCRLSQGNIGQFAFARDGTLALIDGDKGIHLVDAASGADRGWVESGRRDVQALAFSPDGEYFAWASPHAVQIRRMRGLQLRAEEPTEPPAALQAELVARQDTYSLDLGGQTAEAFSDRIGRGEHPAAPAVDLACRLKNVSDQVMVIRSDGDEHVYGLTLCGNGALNVSDHFSQTGVVRERGGLGPTVDRISLAPGESYVFPVRSLGDHTERAYWLLPGEYTVHGHVLVCLSPPPPGTRAEEDGFAFVHFRCVPVRVKVAAPKD